MSTNRGCRNLGHIRGIVAGHRLRSSSTSNAKRYGSYARNTRVPAQVLHKQIRKQGRACGSGAIESTGLQYPRRCKLTGLFWSLEGDEARLALDTLHRNGRWHLLFLHNRDRPLTDQRTFGVGQKPLRS